MADQGVFVLQLVVPTVTFPYLVGDLAQLFDGPHRNDVLGRSRRLDRAGITRGAIRVAAPGIAG